MAAARQDQMLDGRLVVLVAIQKWQKKDVIV
jgi:hypothetical protein